MANILVTGASGFIGRPLLKSLRRSTHNVVPFSFRKFLIDPTHTVPSADCIVHLAALVHIMTPKERPDASEYARVNMQGVIKLAVLAKAAGCKRFIFISSIKAMGESTCAGDALNAQSICSPVDFYGSSKLAAEKALLEVARNTGLEVVILRLPLVYGPNVKGNLMTLIKAIRAGIPLPFRDSHNMRSLLSVENLVSIIEVSISHPAAINEVFLVSDDEDISTAELIIGIADGLSIKARLFWVPTFLLRFFLRALGKADVYDRLFGNLQLDIKKTKTYLDWEPPVKFHDAIRKLIVD